MKKLITVLLCIVMMSTTGLTAAAENEPVELTIIRGGNPNQMVEGNPAAEKIMQETNTDLKITISEDIVTAVNMEVASGELDDIVVADKFTYRDYIGTGYFLELSDLLEEYGQDLLKNISQTAWDLTDVGGKIYGIPYQNANSKYITALRKDWLEKLGFEIKEEYTLDELREILKAFTEQDPDGNVENDTFGLSTMGNGRNWNETFMAIFGAFGGQPNQYYLVDDTFVPFNVSDNFRAALTYIAQLWADGVIDNEVFILNPDQACQKIVQGVSGAFSGWWSGPKTAFANGIEESDPNADLMSVFITSNDGATRGMVDNGMISRVAMISSTCEDPAAAMRLLNYLSTDEGYMLACFGMEGVHYTLDENGYLDDMFYTKDRTWTPFAEIVSRLDISNYLDQKPLGEDADKEAQIGYQFQVIQYQTDLPLYTNIFYGINSTREQEELGTDVDSYVSQMVIEFITGKTPLNDETWEQYKSTWVQKGGQKILDSLAEAYNQLNNTTYSAQIVK